MTTGQTGSKSCLRCGETKPLERFPKRKRCNDGHENVCWDCTNARKRKWEAEHHEQTLASKKKWDQANRQKRIEISIRWARAHKDAVSAIQKRYLDSHPEARQKRNELIGKWHKAHPEKQRESTQRWRVKNRAKTNGYTQRRRAVKRGNGGQYTDLEWRELCDRYDNRCLCCGGKADLTPDHIVPVKLGGTSAIDNIQPLCRSCNSKKHLKIIDYR